MGYCPRSCVSARQRSACGWCSARNAPRSSTSSSARGCVLSDRLHDADDQHMRDRCSGLGAGHTREIERSSCQEPIIKGDTPMKRTVAFAALALLATASLMAQAPKGWKVRADRSTSASDPDAAGTIKFTTSGSGFHVTTPQAAVFWNPANTMSGNYSLKGTFKLLKPSGHTNYYGLVFGGSDLEGAAQSYLYFLVAQDGSWLVKRRTGEATEDVVRKTPNDAVKKPDGSGQSTNALEV